MNKILNYFVLKEATGEEIFVCGISGENPDNKNLYDFYYKVIQQCWKYYNKNQRWTYKKSIKKVLGKDLISFRNIFIYSKREFNKLLEEVAC